MPEWWDPFTAATVPYQMDGSEMSNFSEPGPDGSETFTLNLEPYESRILVLTHARTLPIFKKTLAGSLPAPLDLSDDWKVSFRRCQQTNSTGSFAFVD